MLVTLWRCWEGGEPREGMEALHPSSHRALCISATWLFWVINIYFYNKLVTQQANCFPELGELLQQINQVPGEGYLNPQFTACGSEAQVSNLNLWLIRGGAQSPKILTCWIWWYLWVVSELSLNVGNPAGVVALLGGAKKKKNYHTLSDQKWEKCCESTENRRVFFFLKQALKRSKSETQGSGYQTLECFRTNLQDLKPQLVDSICRVCDSVGLEEQVLTWCWWYWVSEHTLRTIRSGLPSHLRWFQTKGRIELK